MANETFGQALRRTRIAAGLSQPQLAQRIHADQSVVSRWETGRTIPTREVAERVDDVLETEGRLASLLTSGAAPALVTPPYEPVTGDYVESLRDSIAQLVTLDGQHGGSELVPLAERMFRTAADRLATGHCSSSLETDFAATVAELGEVAGWLAFDAMQHGRARQLAMEALHLARLAGDQSMELFLLGNLALQAQESGRAREALRTVQLMERFPLTPRLRVMVALRRARAAADLGDEHAFPLMRRAQVDVHDSVHTDDPDWAWWVDQRELRVHEGGMWRTFGKPERAVDCYAEAVEAVPHGYRWASYLGNVNLTAALIDARSWAEAARSAADVVRLSGEVSSARATRRLRDATATARRLRAPSSLEDTLTAVSCQ